MTDSHPSDHYVHESTDPHGSVGRIISRESTEGFEYDIFEATDC
jgi:hypothetical protein